MSPFEMRLLHCFTSSQLLVMIIFTLWNITSVTSVWVDAADVAPPSDSRSYMIPYVVLVLPVSSLHRAQYDTFRVMGERIMAAIHSLWIHTSYPTDIKPLHSVAARLSGTGIYYLCIYCEISHKCHPECMHTFVSSLLWLRYFTIQQASLGKC